MFKHCFIIKPDRTYCLTYFRKTRLPKPSSLLQTCVKIHNHTRLLQRNISWELCAHILHIYTYLCMYYMSIIYIYIIYTYTPYRIPEASPSLHLPTQAQSARSHSSVRQGRKRQIHGDFGRISVDRRPRIKRLKGVRPKNWWFFLGGNPMENWMMTGGYNPNFRKPPNILENYGVFMEFHICQNDVFMFQKIVTV